MPSYVGNAPLTLVPTNTGSAAYVYAGQPAPEGIPAVDLRRLVDEGFLVKVPDVAEVVIIDPLVDAGLVADPAAVVTTTSVDEQSGALKAPPLAANKAAWVDYRVAQGIPHAEAEGLTKEQLQDDSCLVAVDQQS